MQILLLPGWRNMYMPGYILCVGTKILSSEFFHSSLAPPRKDYSVSDDNLSESHDLSWRLPP